MRLIAADLTSDVVGSYDQTKTTIQGRVASKVIDSATVLGPPLSKWIDVFTDNLGQGPTSTLFATPNGRVFIIGVVAAGVIPIYLYDFDYTTGVSSFVGRINMTTPNTAATTHTVRGLRVVDAGVTGWKIFVLTVGSVLPNGGTFVLNNIDKTDFVQVSFPTIPFATGNGQKAVYFLRNSNTLFTTSTTVSVASPGKVSYTAHPFQTNDTVTFSFGTLPTGLALNTVYFVRNPTANDFELSATRGGASINTTGSGGTAQIGLVFAETALAGCVLDLANNRLYSHNGTAATHQYFVRNTAASMTYATTAVSVSVAAPGKVSHTAHGFQTNDAVVFTAGSVPTGLVVGTVYFVRNPTANDYELSATSGGASITTTGVVSVGAFIGRAFGITGSGFLFKTNDLPALSGTLLTTDSESYAAPVSSPLNPGTLNGNPCAFFATSSNLYMGLLSELTTNTFSWPSLVTSNILGATNEITAPTPLFAGWSSSLDSAIYVTNASKFISKKIQNNIIDSNFGELNNLYYEATNPTTVELGFVTISNFNNESGWLFVMGGTIGQRGLIAVDIRSDSMVDYSFIVTKVLDTPNSIAVVLATVEKLYEQTGNIKVQYRTSGFGSIGGGWTDINIGDNLNAVALGTQIQFKILFRIQSEGSSTPAQINELYFGLVSNAEISDNWEYSFDNSSSGSPTRVGFRLKKAYAATVPTIYFRAFDLSDNLLLLHNTAANAANFEYSTTDGASWLSLGTIPNTVGTLVRYNFTSPPGVKIRPGFRES
jgi:hypothetical protein